MELKGSRTEKNLMDAFSGESQARNKYTFYANKARQEGYEQIACFFEETANNEKEHAEMWFKLLHDNVIGPTNQNLLDGAGGEHWEWAEMYKEFAEIAREEGFKDVARLFDGVGAIEKRHEERYLALLHNIEQGKVFKRDTKEQWICTKCGHIHEYETAPNKCPICGHPQSVFELHRTNY